MIPLDGVTIAVCFVCLVPLIMIGLLIDHRVEINGKVAEIIFKFINRTAEERLAEDDEKKGGRRSEIKKWQADELATLAKWREGNYFWRAFAPKHPDFN